MSLLELFCDVDDFMLRFRPQWKAHGMRNELTRKKLLAEEDKKDL